MLGIILIILSVILKIILALILISLLLLAIILFFPMRYRIDASKYEDISASADMRWLLGALKGGVSFDKSSGNGLHVFLKFLCFTIFDNQKAREWDEKVEERISEYEARKEDRDSSYSAVAETAETVETAETAEAVETAESEEKELSYTENEFYYGSEVKTEEKEIKTEKRPIRERIIDIQEKLWDKVAAVFDKYSDIQDKKDYIMDMVDDEKNRRWLEKTLEKLGKLLLYIMPDFDKLHLRFGFDDPSLTGKILGYVCLLYPFCPDDTDIVPEFDENVVEGEASMHGRFRLIRLVLYMIPVFVNRSFFGLLKQIKSI